MAQEPTPTEETSDQDPVVETPESADAESQKIDVESNVEESSGTSEEQEATEPSAIDKDEALLKLQDQLLRGQAEMQNVRRRAEKDVENARKYSLEKFAAELLPVVDNLDRALDNVADDADKGLLEGVELTRKSLLDVLAKFNVEAINPVGEPFDPQVHEAISMVPNPDMEPNSVMDVFQKGYSLNGRVIRAAMVVVAKAP